MSKETSNDVNGAAIEGVNTAGGFGVVGTSNVGEGKGVEGRATHGTGVVGLATANGTGVVGLSQQGGSGVVGVSTIGKGVEGRTDTGQALVGTAGSRGTAIIGTSDSGFGVVGVSPHGKAIEGRTDTGNAVIGTAGSGTAILGTATSGTAIFGTSNKEGIHGETTSNEFVAAVRGRALNPDGAAPGVLGESSGGDGVVGLAGKGAGVTGFHGDPRLQETTVANDGGRAGVFGASENGAGLLGYSRDHNSPAVYAFGGLKAIALGKPLAALFEGDVQVDGDVFLPGADCAEHFDVSDCESCEAGTVMVIEDGGTLKPCDRKYDKRAAGVISGAGTFAPGIILDKRPSTKNRLPIALIGKVYCKVDANLAPIEVGDMLTTSSTPGHAMKAAETVKAFGAVIGKALSAIDAGQALIPILVTLQ